MQTWKWIPVLTSKRVFLWAFIISLIASIIYSDISMIRFYEYKLTVLDLGVNAAQIYLVFHGGLPLTLAGLKQIAFNKLIYLLMAPFYALYPKMWTLLIFQDVLLSFAALPLAMISWKRTNSIFISMVIPILWNLYFPVEGIFWFDFHFMALFPFFFLMGIMMEDYGKRKTSFLFLFLSAITDYLAPFIVLFYLTILFLKKYRDDTDDWRYYRKIMILFFGLLIFIFIAVNLETSWVYTYTFTSNFFPSTSTGPGFISEKIYFIIGILLPFMFLPFIAPLDLLIAIPGISLALFNNNPGFFQQGYQYPALYSPGIFIAFITALSMIRKRVTGIKIPKFNKMVTGKGMERFFVIISVIIIVTTGIALGPSAAFEKNSIMAEIQKLYPIYSQNEYSINQVNSKYIGYLNSEISMIPKGASVLIQNNMPCMIQNYNSTIPGLIHKGIVPEYIIAYPYTSWFTRVILPSMGENATPLYTIDNYLTNYNYSILSEKSGITLYKLNSVGNVNNFIPYDQNISFTEFKNSIGSILKGGEYFHGNYSNDTLIYGPYFLIPQGKFNLTFHFTFVNTTAGSSLDIQALSVSNYKYQQEFIGARQFKVSGNHTQMNLTVSLYSPYYFTNIQYNLAAENFSGSFFLSSVTLTQMAY
ncbi:MAG: DUF2079 domain-containing protein [Thermoplasmataceae archaeon]